MYDYSTSSDITRGSSHNLMGFWLGAVVGAGVALLFAPANGAETRHKVAGAAKKLGQGAKDTIGKVNDFAKNIKHDAKSAVESGKDAFSRTKSEFNPSRAV